MTRTAVLYQPAHVLIYWKDSLHRFTVVPCRDNEEAEYLIQATEINQELVIQYD